MVDSQQVETKFCEFYAKVNCQLVLSMGRASLRVPLNSRCRIEDKGVLIRVRSVFEVSDNRALRRRSLGRKERGL